MINTVCIATRGRPPPSICHMRVRRGSKTQAGRLGSLGGALGPGEEALGAGARDPTQTKVRIKRCQRDGRGERNQRFCLLFLTPQERAFCCRGVHILFNLSFNLSFNLPFNLPFNSPFNLPFNLPFQCLTMAQNDRVPRKSDDLLQTCICFLRENRKTRVSAMT